MKSSDIHPIDELFRQEFESFSPSVAAKTMPTSIKTAVKKGMFYKFSIAKLNIFYVAAIGITAAAAAGVLTAKYLSPSKQTALENNSTTMVETAQVPQTQVAVEQAKTSSVTFENAHTPAANETIYTANVHKTQTQTAAKMEVQSTPNAPSNDKANTAIAPMAQTNNQIADSIAQAMRADSVKSNSVAARKVVYIKPQQVVVQDTIVKIVKKKRPKS